MLLPNIVVTTLKLSDNSHCRSAYYPAWIVCASDNGYCRPSLCLGWVMIDGEAVCSAGVLLE